MDAAREIPRVVLGRILGCAGAQEVMTPAERVISDNIRRDMDAEGVPWAAFQRALATVAAMKLLTWPEYGTADERAALWRAVVRHLPHLRARLNG